MLVFVDSNADDHAKGKIKENGSCVSLGPLGQELPVFSLNLEDLLSSSLFLCLFIWSVKSDFEKVLIGVKKSRACAELE